MTEEGRLLPPRTKAADTNDRDLPPVLEYLLVAVGLKKSTALSPPLAGTLLWVSRFLYISALVFHLVIELTMLHQAHDQISQNCEQFRADCVSTVVTSVNFLFYVIVGGFLYVWMVLNASADEILRTHRRRLGRVLRSSLNYIMMFYVPAMSYYIYGLSYIPSHNSAKGHYLFFSDQLVILHGICNVFFTLPTYYIFLLQFYAETVRLRYIISDFLDLVLGRKPFSFETACNAYKEVSFEFKDAQKVLFAPIIVAFIGLGSLLAANIASFIQEISVPVARVRNSSLVILAIMPLTWALYAVYLVNRASAGVLEKSARVLMEPQDNPTDNSTIKFVIMVQNRRLAIQGTKLSAVCIIALVVLAVLLQLLATIQPLE
jgi:hypothetical protein